MRNQVKVLLIVSVVINLIVIYMLCININEEHNMENEIYYGYYLEFNDIVDNYGSCSTLSEDNLTYVLEKINKAYAYSELINYNDHINYFNEITFYLRNAFNDIRAEYVKNGNTSIINNKYLELLGQIKRIQENIKADVLVFKANENAIKDINKKDLEIFTKIISDIRIISDDTERIQVKD